MGLHWIACLLLKLPGYQLRLGIEHSYIRASLVREGDFEPCRTVRTLVSEPKFGALVTEMLESEIQANHVFA